MAAVGAPVLLRNATARRDHDTDREPEVVSTSRLDELTTAARRFTPQSASSHIEQRPASSAKLLRVFSMWLPVSLIFSNGNDQSHAYARWRALRARRMQGKWRRQWC